MIVTRTFSAQVASEGLQQLVVQDARLTLDEGWSPFYQATIVVKRPATLALFSALDPAKKPKVTITIQQSLATFGAVGASPTSRTFVGYVTARMGDPRAGTVSLNIESRERFLMDYAPVSSTPDRAPLALQSSVRNIVTYVLQKAMGGSGPIDSTTADFTVYDERTNYWDIVGGTSPYPSGQYLDTGGQLVDVQLGNRVLFVFPRRHPTFGNWVTTRFRRVVNLAPGRTYTFSALVTQNSAQTGSLSPHARKLGVAFQGDEETRTYRQAFSAQKSNAPGSQRLSVTFTVPVGVTKTVLELWNGSSLDQGGQYIGFQNILVTEGDGLTPRGTVENYFDGNTTNAGGYVYDWSGDAGSSNSTRTPTLDRTSDVLIWQQGVTAKDFLDPILAGVGMRLWCDENDQWRLTRDTYSVPGTVYARAGQNLYEATDLTSRTASQSDGTPLFVDGVVLKYEWTTEQGVAKTFTDIASGTETGQSTKPYVIEYRDTAFPGGFPAQYLLARFLRRRRQMPATAAMQLTATPGMSVEINLGQGERATGYLDAVTFDMGSDDMTIGSKDLTTTAG